MDLVYNALTSDFDKDTYEQSLKTDAEFALIELNIHFLLYMKSLYNIPFILSDLLINIINTGKIFGKNKNPGAYFYINYDDLDKHITKRFDTMFAGNQIEIFGKAWGLHYVYEFLRFYNLISDEYYRLMLENVAFLKNEFSLAIANDLWKMKFVTTWPESKANLFEYVPEVFTRKEITDYNKQWELVSSLIPALPFFARIENEIKAEKIKENKYKPFDNNITMNNDGSYIRTDPKTGRNDPCPCGSGKKFKNCCLNK